MLFLVATLLRGFGPAEISGSVDPPAAPTLSIADNGDGSGAVVTISGSELGSVNVVFVQTLTGSWSVAGSRSGDGEVSLSLAAGQFLAYAQSTLGGQSVSSVVLFSVSDTSTPPIAPPSSSLTFKQMRANLFYDKMLDDGSFAELVTVREPGRADRTVYGKKVENESDLLAAQFEDEEKELLLMRFGRNESHAKGGIAKPTLGLAVLRAGETTPFAYTGKTLRGTAHSWTLVFARPRTAQVG